MGTNDVRLIAVDARTGIPAGVMEPDAADAHNLSKALKPGAHRTICM